MSHSPDTFDDEELTQMAMDILIDIKPKPNEPMLISEPSSLMLESNTKTDLYLRSKLFHHENDNDHNEPIEVHTKSIPPSSTLTTSIDPALDPNTLHAAYPKPKLSILSSNQLSSSDSLNLSLPPLPKQQKQRHQMQSQQEQEPPEPITILSNLSSNDSFNIPLPPIPTTSTQKAPQPMMTNIVSCDAPKYRKRSKKAKHRSMNTPPPNHSNKPNTFQRSKTVNFIRKRLIDVPSSNLSISPRQRTSVRRQSSIPNFDDDEFVDELEPMKIQKHKSANEDEVTNTPDLYGQHASIYIDFDHKERKQRRKRKRKKKKSAQRSVSPGIVSSKSKRLKKYKKRETDRNRAKSVVSFKSQMESVSDNPRIAFDRYSSRNFKQREGK